MEPVKKITIALADDHAMVRKSLTEVINSLHTGLVVILQASNGKELIEALEQTDTLPDVVVLDINMPIMNGYQTAPEIRKRWPEIKILAMSLHSHEFAVISMLRKGACGYIVKDADPDELFTAIEWVYDKGYYHNELVKGHLPRMMEMPELKDREIEFLVLCCSDMKYEDIAEKMGIGLRAVEDYRAHLFKKLGIKSKTGLAVFAMKVGLIPEET